MIGQWSRKEEKSTLLIEEYPLCKGLRRTVEEFKKIRNHRNTVKGEAVYV